MSSDHSFFLQKKFNGLGPSGPYTGECGDTGACAFLLALILGPFFLGPKGPKWPFGYNRAFLVKTAIFGGGQKIILCSINRLVAAENLF